MLSTEQGDGFGFDDCPDSFEVRHFGAAAGEISLEARDRARVAHDKQWPGSVLMGFSEYSVNSRRSGGGCFPLRGFDPLGGEACPVTVKCCMSFVFGEALPSS